MNSVRLVYGVRISLATLDYDEPFPDFLNEEHGVLYLRETEQVAPIISFNMEELVVPYKAYQSLRAYVKAKGLEWIKPKWFVFADQHYE